LEHTVLTEAKIELYRQMREAGVGSSRLDQIEQALLAVGKRLRISV
jgi:hypothetical protein